MTTRDNAAADDDEWNAPEERTTPDQGAHLGAKTGSQLALIPVPGAADLPAPPVPPDCDLRSFPDMPLSVQLVRDSELVQHGSAAGVRAALLLWCASWHQVPAASLPWDDRELARMAGYGRNVKAWEKIQAEALRGFTLCSDGRLYHALICDRALKAWATKRGRSRGAEITNALKRQQSGDAQPAAQPNARARADLHATEQNRTEKKETPTPSSAQASALDLEHDREFWPVWTKKADKAASRKAWRKARKDGATVARIVQAAREYLATVRDPQYCKNPASWLNAQDWTEPTETPADQPEGPKFKAHDAEDLLAFLHAYLFEKDQETGGWKLKPREKRSWHGAHLCPAPGQPGSRIEPGMAEEAARRAQVNIGTGASSLKT